MTSRSRRKPRTTVPRTRRAVTALSAAALLALAAGSAAGQYPARTQPPPGQREQPRQPQRATSTVPVSAGQVMYFRKPADALVPVSGSGGEVAWAGEPAGPPGVLPDVSPAPSRPPAA